MTVLNQYIVNQQTYIKKMMEQPLINFTTPKGEQATWDSITVKFTKVGGITKNFLFNNNNHPHAKFTTPLNDNDYLSKDLHHLVFAYLLELLKENTSLIQVNNKQAIARKFLGLINKNIALMTIAEVQETVDTINNNFNLSYFFDWLHKCKMVSSLCIPYLITKYRDIRQLSGDDALSAEKEKIPEDKAMIALGAIFFDTIPAYKDDKTFITEKSNLTDSTLNRLDAFTCTMSVLAMSAPNRVAAEQTILSRQRLQSHTETVNGIRETVHYLIWPGSKGYENNQKHINCEMAESVDRALHYTGLITEPARVLARFYKNPKLPLNKVLGIFKPSKENLALLEPSMSKPTSLIHLGLMLGFFEGTNKSVRVTADTLGALEVPTTRGHIPKYIKPINKLVALDKLFFVIKCPYMSLLLGVKLGVKSLINKYSAGKKVMTVTEFENYYISTNQKNITGYNKTQTKKINYEDALFTFTEKQLFSRSASHFLLVPLGTLEHYYYRDLNKQSLARAPTIFERYGFCSEFKIRPHQFRHWQNNFLDNNDLPHLLISMLSGRKSPEQTLEYIHTTNAQKASVISDILFKNKTEEQEPVQVHITKRLQSKVEYDAAIENLSPTFVSDVGFCVQNLTLSPCTYMNDFESQCALCSSSCHIAHDQDAIRRLNDDLKVQKKRLEMHPKALNFTTSKGMQKWFKTHYRNTCMLEELLNTLSDKSIKAGSIIRVLNHSNVIRITDLEKKEIQQRAISLPNPNEAIQVYLEAKSQPSVAADAKANFFGFLGSI
jgi:hypothetical protein